MDRYNTLVSRHLISAVIEVGQAKGGVELDTDAMRDWLAALPAKERSKIEATLMELITCLREAYIVAGPEPVDTNGARARGLAEREI